MARAQPGCALFRAPCTANHRRNKRTLIPPRDEPWVFSPVLGLPAEGAFLRYPIQIVDAEIHKTVDLRRPDTLRWLFETFVAIEVSCTGSRRISDGVLHVMKSEPPADLEVLVSLLLAQSLGGGSPFLQGIGAFLRAAGAEALIFPSARTDSRSVFRNGELVESDGYALVDYRDAPSVDFEAERFFGVLPRWRDEGLASLSVTLESAPEATRLELKGLRALQQCRFAVFHDWTQNTLVAMRHGLSEREVRLDDPVRFSLRRPSEIVGPDSERVLGTDAEFRIREGGPATGFLTRWLGKNVGEFVASVLPAVQSPDWEGTWSWDEANWFLYCACRRRCGAQILRSP